VFRTGSFFFFRIYKISSKSGSTTDCITNTENSALKHAESIAYNLPAISLIANESSNNIHLSFEFLASKYRRLYENIGGRLLPLILLLL
jgi:hypothetical protein